MAISFIKTLHVISGVQNFFWSEAVP